MPKVLIADDSGFQVQLLVTALDEEGFEVVVAQDTLRPGCRDWVGVSSF